jgi:hypothetical protein
MLSIHAVTGGMHKCIVSDRGPQGKKGWLKCTVLGIHGLYKNFMFCPTVFICHFDLTVPSFPQGKKSVCISKYYLFNALLLSQNA